MNPQGQPSTIPSAARKFQSRNPATGEMIAEFPFLSDNEVNQKIERSQKAFLTYSQTDLGSRREKILKLTSLIEKNSEKLAKTITQEVGKPITVSNEEIQMALAVLRYYVENAEKFLTPKTLMSEDKKNFVEYHPLGSILFITPFNYPFVLSFIGTIPSLLIGNTILYRPSDSTPMVGKAIEDLMIEAGFNNGEFQLMFTSQDQTELVLSNKYVKGVSFTGSTKAGRAIAAIAGKYGKRATMELGGSDPFIVLNDADVENAVKIGLNARLKNSGQVCFAPKRFLIDDSVYDKFKQLLLEQVTGFKPANPMNPETKIGPLARTDLRETIERQVQEGQRQGAKLLYGGKRPEDPELQKGDFFIPTVLELQNENNILFKEETFGPVFSLLRVRGEDEMVRIANDSDYGLTCTIIGEDTDRAQRLGKKIETGSIVYNDIFRPNFALPFGGVKGSGFGRQFGDYGMHEFANIKTVMVSNQKSKSFSY